MSIDPLTAALELGKAAIDKIWPDPIKRAEEYRLLEQMHQDGDLKRLELQVQLLLAQLDVNKTEAQHKSIFVAGWRPFIGWVGGASLLYAGVIYPMLTWIWGILVILGYVPIGVVAPPYIDSALLGTIVTGMLGIGGMRSFDKAKGTQTDDIPPK